MTARLTYLGRKGATNETRSNLEIQSTIYIVKKNRHNALILPHGYKMPFPAFTAMCDFFEALKTQFTNDSVIYGLDLDTMDRLRLNKPQAKEDVIHIYAAIDGFNTELLPPVSAKITAYLNDRSFFKSKKDITKQLSAEADRFCGGLKVPLPAKAFLNRL